MATINALRAFTIEMGKALTSRDRVIVVVLGPQEKAKGRMCLGFSAIIVSLDVLTQLGLKTQGW